MKREIFETLKSWKILKNRKPLILKGARQVGKTYILKLFGKECFDKTHYLNFEKDIHLRKIFEEDIQPKKILEQISIFLNCSINTTNDLLIFDEIQEAPKALTSLKYFEEELPHLPICAAGSLLGVHLNDASFPVGKVKYFQMYPMNFEEFLQGIGENKLFEFLQHFRHNFEKEHIPDFIHLRLWELLKTYFFVGGLPEIVQTFAQNKDNVLEAMKQAREKQDDLITTYIADMAKHSGKQNSMHIERLWRNIPSQLAKELDGSAAKFKFKGVLPGINRYGRLVGTIDWLIASGLIIKCQMVNNGNIPFSAYAAENNFKLYVFDVGILGALSQLPAKTILDYAYGSYKGYFAENFVAQELITTGIKNLYSYRKRNSEIEFLLEVDGNVYPLEVKSGWKTQTKSLKIFAERYNSKYKTIISANKFHLDKNNKAIRLPLYLSRRFSSMIKECTQ